MGIRFHPAAIKQTRWYEYVIRFVFGGLVIMGTGYVANHYGPVIGGLFLAFPSIFPASVTLVETHKERKEKQKGESKEDQEAKGLKAASLTTEGTVMGAVGLAAFGLVIWGLTNVLSPILVLTLALIAWFCTSVLTWWVVTTITNRK